MIDVYQMVTDRILEIMAEGEIPWNRPWLSIHGAHNRVTGRRYSLLNQLMLKHAGGYLTLKQANDLGCRVRKGEKSEFVVFWKWPEKGTQETMKEDDEDTNGKKRWKGPILRYYRVFHESQVEGLKQSESEDISLFEKDPITEAETLVNGYVGHESIRMEVELSNRAYYSPATDTIHVPDIRQYSQSEEYYSTVLHEMVHSTGHNTRLNRVGLENVRFGSDNYSREELIAEMGAAMLLHTIGISSEETLRNSAAYIQGWGKAISADRRMFALAAAQAEKAVDFILNRSPVSNSGEMRPES